MKKIFASMLTAFIIVLAAPAMADGATQIWRCEMGDGATEEQVLENAQKWLAAVRGLKGCEAVEVSVLFPVAVNNTGETDLLFVLHTPGLKEWGVFWDAYQDSDAGDLDGVNRELVTPTDSALWQSMKVEGPDVANKAGTVTQMWRCEMDDDATEEQVMDAAAKWLAAARTIEGGENIEAYVNFPVAVNNNGQTDMLFVVTAPNFTDWGAFWDGYTDSDAGDLDATNRDLITPTDSALWESVKVK